MYAASSASATEIYSSKQFLLPLSPQPAGVLSDNTRRSLIVNKQSDGALGPLAPYCKANVKNLNVHLDVPLNCVNQGKATPSS